MEDQPTCGKGLVENSVLPAGLGKLAQSVAGVLEAHVEALDLTDEESKRERDVYIALAERHRRIAADLRSIAASMAGYRDLPMGRHDAKAMAGPKTREVFERFVAVEEELLSLLQKRLPADRAMLRQMGHRTQETR